MPVREASNSASCADFERVRDFFSQCISAAAKNNGEEIRGKTEEVKRFSESYLRKKYRSGERCQLLDVAIQHAAEIFQSNRSPEDKMREFKDLVGQLNGSIRYLKTGQAINVSA